MVLRNKDSNKLKYKPSFSYASMQLESPKRRKYYPTPVHPIKIHGNSKNVKEISKLSCVADFKRKFQLDCMFPSSAGGKDGKTRK